MRKKRLASYGSAKIVNENILFLESQALYRDVWTTKEFEPNTARKYTGNFVGLMLELGIPAEDHLATMHLNNYNSPYDYDGKTMIIKIPNVPSLTRMR